MRRGKSEKCGFCFGIISMVFQPIIATIIIPDYETMIASCIKPGRRFLAD